MKREEILLAIKKSELLKNTSILITGTVIAQLIPILLQPLLRRTFSPDVFGVYSVYASLVGILSVLASMKYELAIILPRNDKTAANLLFLSIISNVIFSLLIFTIIAFFYKKISVLFNIDEAFSYYLFLVPAGTLFYSSYQCINYWLIRKKRFMPVSINKLFRKGTEGTVQVGLGLAKINAGLLAGDIAGHISNMISGVIQTVRSGFSFKYFSRARINYALHRYSEFPKFNLIPAFMSSVSYLLPVIIVNKFYSSENAGYFDLSRLVLSIPLALIATSLASVLLQRLSEKSSLKKGILNDLLPIFLILLVIVLVEILVIEFYGIELFGLVFGSKWSFSGEISRILVWSYAFNFIVSSFSSVFISLNKIKLLSFWQLFYFIAISALALFRYYAFKNFLQIYVYIEVGCYLIYIVLLIKVIYSYEISRKKIMT